MKSNEGAIFAGKNPVPEIFQTCKELIDSLDFFQEKNDTGQLEKNIDNMFFPGPS